MQGSNSCSMIRNFISELTRIHIHEVVIKCRLISQNYVILSISIKKKKQKPYLKKCHSLNLMFSEHALLVQIKKNGPTSSL